MANAGRKRPSMANNIKLVAIIIAIFIICAFIIYYKIAILPVPYASPLVNSVHPLLFFNNISQCNGFMNHNSEPWASWQASIMSDANSSLKANFLSGADYSTTAADLGMAYQLTKDPKYAAAAASAITYWNSTKFTNATGVANASWTRDMALSSYVIGYDLAQPGMTAAQDGAARDALATLADAAYHDATFNGDKYIDYNDNYGREYWSVGLAGMALYDYTDPNNISITTTPVDWQNMGENFTMVNDKMHPSYNRGVVTFSWDNAGHNLDGAYREYDIVFESLYANAYTHFYGVNFLDKYPLAKEHFKSETWETFPNGYMPNTETLGETRQHFEQWTIGLYDAANQSYMASQIAKEDSGPLLPYGSDDYGDDVTPIANYIMTKNISTISKTDPPLDMLNPQSTIMTIRNGFDTDSSYINIIQWGKFTDAENSNRDTGHNDQLNIEYYDMGDLVLGDGGEPKYVYSDINLMYGMYSEFHNVLLVENPSLPFSVSSWAESNARGFAKGWYGAGGPYHNDIIDPITTRAAVSTPWIKFVDDNLTANLTDDKITLSSPINWERQLLYPDGDYLIVVDRADSSGSWVYRSLFRPSTNSITPTSDDGNTIGHEDMYLSIGDTPYDWQNAEFNNEVTAGKSNKMAWTAVNLYGKSVTTSLYTVPASQVIVNKLITRIAGYDAESNVYAPNVYFRQDEPNSSLYRVTAIMAGYTSDASRSASSVIVNGTGNAMKVQSGDSTDIAYTGSGNSTFEALSTNADTMFFRNNITTDEYLMINGSFIENAGKNIVISKNRLTYFTMRQGTGTEIVANAPATTAVTMSLKSIPTAVTMDGATYSHWSTNGSGIILTLQPGEHTYNIS